MDEKSLKTSVWQRIVIIAVAVILVGSMIVAYMLIVMGGQKSNSDSNAELEAKIAELSERYEAKSAELKEAAQPLNDRYFDSFKGYISSAKAYNAASANAAGIEVQDLKTGTGRTIGEDDTDYLSYYVGWCPDGSIFSSSYNDNENPTALNSPFDPSVGTIEGWKKGMAGAKIGGVRQVTMSGDLAYGDTQEICGSKGSPLKFIIMSIDPDQKISDLMDELSQIQMEMLSIYYGGSI